MADVTPEQIRKSIKTYVIIGFILMVATGVTVGLSFVEMPTHGMNIMVGLLLAAAKVALVGWFFMHLGHEKSLIYKVLAFTLVFVTALFLLFYMSHSDPLVYKDF